MLSQTADKLSKPSKIFVGVAMVTQDIIFVSIGVPEQKSLMISVGTRLLKSRSVSRHLLASVYLQ